MAFTLTEEQQQLRDMATEFFQDKSPVSALRKLRDDKNADGFDRALWKEMAELGFAGVMLPEAYGGTDFGPVGLGLVLEQAGRTLTASPLVSTVLTCGNAVLIAGNDAQKQEILPAIASGELLMALALEESVHHKPDNIALSAKKDGAGYKLNGAKTFVLDGHVADKLIVVARTSGKPDDKTGVTLFLVDAKAAGVKITRLSMADSRNAANIEFKDVSVSADAVLGSLDNGADVLEQVLDIARIGLAAEMLGLVQEAFDITLAYIKERKQFGVVIGSFQALKHRAADMFSEIELCRSVVMGALSALGERSNEVPLLASLAKCRLSDVSRTVTNEGVQMHGGMGMTDPLDIGLYMKRARVAAATFGDGIYHRDRFATLSGY